MKFNELLNNPESEQARNALQPSIDQLTYLIVEIAPLGIWVCRMFYLSLQLIYG